MYLNSQQIHKINLLLPPSVSIEAKITKRKRHGAGNRREPTTGKMRGSFIGRDIGLKSGGKAAMQCLKELQKLKRHSMSGPFLHQVDPVALSLPNYTDVVQDPMDINSVEKNLKSGKYSNS
jgi:hypothetical protein